MKCRALLIVLLLAVATRAGLLYAGWDSPGLLTPDSRDYAALADDLRADGTFGPRHSPEIFRTPGYPLLIAACAERGLLFFVQILLDVALVALVWKLAAMVVSRRAAIIAATFQAITPLVVAASCRVLSDSVYAFLFMLSVLLLVRHIKKGSFRALVASAILLSAACYFRPVGLAMAGVFALVLLTRPQRLWNTGVFTGVVLACIAPWVLRNQAAGGYWGFSSFATDSMYAYSAPQTLAQAEGISMEDARAKLLKKSRSPTDRSTPGDRARLRADAALQVIGKYPWTFARIHLKGCAGFWLPGATDVLEIAGMTKGQAGTLDVLRTRGIRSAAKHYFDGDIAAMIAAVPMVLILLAIYFGVLIGVLKKLRLRMSATCRFFFLLVLVSAFAGGTASTPRFRVPVTGLLNIAAAFGWLAIVDRLGRRKEKASSGEPS